MMYRVVVLFVVVTLMGGFVADEARCENFAGSLSSADSEIVALGDWAAGAVTLSWNITDMGTYYHYEYTLDVPQSDISHFIIGVSDTFESSNFWGETGTFGDTIIGDFDNTNGNPDIPGTLHGLKFDDTSGTTLTISFDSDRQPVWGDFYAKDGVHTEPSGTKITNQVWNTGFSLANPTDPPANGTINNHVLVPDTMSVVPVLVPEPTTVSLLLTGLLGLAWVVRRRCSR